MRNRSFTLVQLVEDHAEEIASLAVRQIKRDPRLELIGSIPADELERRAVDILRNLGEWLVATDPEVAVWAERLGGTRFTQSIPLNETIRALCQVKSTIIDFIRQRHVVWTAVQIYSEEETEHRIGRFFDDLLCHVARGYESARSAAVAKHEKAPIARPKMTLANRMRA